MARQGDTQPPLQGSPKQPVHSPGPLLDRKDFAPHGFEGVAQGNAGSVVTLIELRDEQKAGAGRSG
jgi:hypothetical protein